MNVTLVSIDAKYIHTNNAVRLLEANTSFPVTILEFTIKDSIEYIINAIQQTKPDVVGFSVYIWNVEQIKSIVSSFENNDTTIILGGPEVSYDPEYFLEYPAVDIIVRGEGEHVFHQLLERISQNKPYDDIDSIAYKKDNNTIVKPLMEIHDLSTIQSPHYRTEDIVQILDRIAYIESSRGCPYKCSYCLSSLEKTVRFFPVEEVQKALSYYVQQGVKTVKFLDRTFNANRHTLDIINHIIAIDNNQTVYQFEITGDVLSKDLVDYIHEHARNGLFRFEIGIQSTNEQTNLLVDRHQNTPRLFDRIKHIQDAGIIDLHLDLIAGLPEEDLSSFQHTFNSVFLLAAKELQLGFLKMLRGTKIRLQAKKYGYRYNKEAPYEIIESSVLSKADIEEIKLVEHMLEIYHNKGYFGDHLHNYILTQPSPYQFFLKIGRHYKKNNYPLHRYQLIDVYKHLIELLDDDTTYLIYQDYLERSKIKPQIFFPLHCTNKDKNTVYKYLSNLYDIPLHKLFKHSVLLRHNDEYFCAYYHDFKCHTYKTKAPK